MTTALTIGTFDVPHIGHAVLIKRCEKLADDVIVGVNSDRFVFDYKGGAPVFDETERFDAMSYLCPEVYINDGPGRDLILDICPTYLVVGGDWIGRDYLAQINMTAEELRALDITLVFVPYTEVISTTEIKARLSW